MQAYAQGSMIERILAAEGEAVDLYMGEKSNLRHSKVKAIQRTNAVFNLSSLSGGSSSVYVSPDSGISTIMVAIELPAPVSGGFDYTGYALAKSWGYFACNFIQMRVGNSSLFQWTGRQLMLQAIQSAGNQVQADDLMALAGQELKVAADFADPTKRWAYITIPMPWCGAESNNAPLPLPTELLSSPVQFIVNLKSLSEILALNGVTPTTAAIPQLYAQSFLQVKQHIPIGDSHRVKHEKYALPCTFVQQENSVSISGTGLPQEIPLLGFRNGSIQKIDVYVVNKDVDPKLNPFAYVLPSDVRLIYMGNQLHTYNGYSSEYWTTVFSNKPARWTNSVITPGATPTSAALVTKWVELPFESLYTELDAEEPISSSGLAIQNGILNLQLTLPANTNGYTVYYKADIESAIVFHQGTADYAF